ncbi:MAG: hypothetical protein GXP60_06100 [Epsilonproteobacteria bacterium]|nr:hypothetical protein [Campylobacterota bacterium]
MRELNQLYTIWYDELRGGDYELVGKKNANLGEMMHAGIPISPGFAITIHANDSFIEKTGIRSKIETLVKKNGEATDENIKKLSKTIMSEIESADIPSEIEEDILENYHKLCKKCNLDAVPAAVRSSGGVSMPGQMETYLNIRGDKDLIRYIKKCWSSSYNVEAIHYRVNRDMSVLFNIGVGIPKMVHSKVSGVIFTLNPINGDFSKISVDASYGLGEAIVSGLVTPDTYLIDKVTLELIKTKIGSKEIKCVYEADGSDIKKVDVDNELRKKSALTNQELAYLAETAVKIENYYGKAYDIEFGIDEDLPFPENVIVLQVRPESIWNKKKDMSGKIGKPADVMNIILNNLISGIKAG